MPQQKNTSIEAISHVLVAGLRLRQNEKENTAQYHANVWAAESFAVTHAKHAG
tara:strand:+ start:1103 stop:1261 length:159 start_codon:yes stop_codon:yes gene_type:complete